MTIDSGHTAVQVIACEQGRIELEEVFGKEARGFVANLNTEGHHRGAVAAARSLAQQEVCRTTSQPLHFSNCVHPTRIYTGQQDFNTTDAIVACCTAAQRSW